MRSVKKNAQIWTKFIFDMFVIEFGPVGVFFIIFYLSNFVQAALALGFSTFVALVASRLINGRVPWFAVFTGSITIVIACITYWLNQPLILIVKDTVYYLFFASLLAVSLFLNKHLFKFFFGHIFVLTDTGWKKLEKRWLYFFVFAGISNELVRVLLTPDEWVLYKQGIVFLFIGFGLYQLRMIAHHKMEDGELFGLRPSRMMHNIHKENS